MLAAPLEQSAVPVALLATRLITQTLYGGLNVFGIGSGGPNRQPTLVQFRLLPVSVEARLPRVSAVLEFPGKVDTEIRAMRGSNEVVHGQANDTGPADLHAAVQEGRRPPRG